MGEAIKVDEDFNKDLEGLLDSDELATFISYLSLEDPVGAAVDDDWLREKIRERQNELYKKQDEIRAKGVDLDKILEEGIGNEEEYKIMEELTPFYYDLMAHLFYFVKLVSPMSAVGAERLEYFMDYEMELKDIFLLDKDDLDAFGPLIPAELQDKVGLPEYFTFGAVRRENGVTNPAGVIIFQESLDASIEKICANLLWLNVRQKYEHKGVADELMAMFFAEVNNAQVEIVDCDVSPMAGNIEALTYFLQRWHFFSDFTYSPEVEVSLEEIAKSEYVKLINVDTSRITPLSALSDEEYKKIMEVLEKKNSDDNDYYKYHVDREYYDPQLSGIIQQKNNISALFVHKNGAQELELDICQSTDNTISPAMLILAKNAAALAARKYTAETIVKYVIRDEKIAALTDQVFKGHGIKRIFKFSVKRDGAFTQEIYDSLKEEVVVKGNFVDYLEPDDRALLDGLFEKFVLQS
ncbi:hypothetical protein SAMN05216351_101301 [Pseudobutyrivibrio sp. JW11]|uniref:hypothetical protein n=1 Tax=Pseudobutyrivibrio sp. JW11 TaxID=1855302 RepID=UPI0008E84AB3|nr:hypothetical protein [Pseudobutyrivibrio sp. JW11]SFN82950.1 hypothetical protein SAMN05216351_101301 [Pseudobutyrivibrio sp. JW11]